MLQVVNNIFERVSEFREKHGNKKLCDLYWGLIEAIMFCEEDEEQKVHRAMQMVAMYGQFLFRMDIITWKELLSWLDKDSRYQVMEYGIYIDQKDLNIRDGRALLYNSHCKVSGHSYVSLFGESTAKAEGTSHINVYDDSRCYGRDVSIAAFDRSEVRIKGYGRLEAYDNCNSVASGYSMVIMNDDARCSASLDVHFVDKRKVPYPLR